MGIIDWALNKFGYAKLNKKATPAGVIEKEFGAYPSASRQMEDDINLWYAMYINHPPWENCDVRPLGIPESIGRELTRQALAEFSMTVTGGPRGDYINEQAQRAATKFDKNLEIGLCLGGIALKPYVDNDRLLVDASTTGFTPTHFDGEGKCIGGAFKSLPTRQGREWFVRMEYHDFQTREDGSKVYVIENKAFKSCQDGNIGAQVALDTVDEWKGMRDRETIENLTGPLFSYFKPPQANNIEPESQLGVSVYAGATVDLVKQADKQWAQLRREYRTGKRRMLINGTAMSASQVDDDIYEYGNFTSDTTFFQFINPELRDDPIYNGFQRVLQRIELNVGLSFGTLSEQPNEVEQRATEVLLSKQRQYVTEKAIQKAFESTLDGLIYAMNAWCDLAGLAPAGEYEVSYSWGDGVLDDPETRRQDMSMDMIRVDKGLMSRKQFVMKWEKVDDKTAEAILAEIDDMSEIVTERQEEIE